MLSVAQRWALAPSAILTRYYLEDPAVLGGVVPGDEALATARELLAGDWESTDPATLRGTLDALLAGRLATDFLAWNLASVSFVAGQGFLAGWIAEAAAWDACLTAARLLQQTLSGWDHLGTEYLRGCEHWFGEPDQALHYIHRALILERGGPWSLPWSTPLA